MHTAIGPFTLEFWKEGRTHERRSGVDRAPLTRGGAVRAALGRSTRLLAESQA
ncbi:hypothetical protein AAIB46_01700 [Streptomyces sp. 35M1]|uniref:hypothetical protein n=1 Tax=Streptomyces sp. 35M1 TaxID=3142978 RepID=UPI003990BB35